MLLVTCPIKLLHSDWIPRTKGFPPYFPLVPGPAFCVTSPSSQYGNIPNYAICNVSSNRPVENARNYFNHHLNTDKCTWISTPFLQKLLWSTAPPLSISSQPPVCRFLCYSSPCVPKDTTPHVWVPLLVLPMCAQRIQPPVWGFLC